jgi:hypothetical protein
MADVSHAPPATEQNEHLADNTAIDHGHSNNGVPESPAPHQMSAKEYALTRLSTLRPPMHHAPNPIRLLMTLNTKQWMFFLVAFLAWVCASFPFHGICYGGLGTNALSPACCPEHIDILCASSNSILTLLSVLGRL